MRPLTQLFPLSKQVGGSTLAGVLRGVCEHYGVACINPPDSGPGSSHSRIGWKKDDEIAAAVSAAYEVGYEHVAITNHGAFTPAAAAHLGRPLMFTTVRHPVGRVLSAYFYNLLGSHRSHQGLPLEAGAQCIKALRQGDDCELMQGFERHYVNGDGIFGRNHIFKYVAGDKRTPAQAIAQYDFVFVTERFDESLVAFMLEYGLALGDIAYLRTKDRAGARPTVEDVPQRYTRFITERNELDEELFRLGTKALDARIAKLKAAGHDFDAILMAFAEVQVRCGKEPLGKGESDACRTSHPAAKPTDCVCVSVQAVVERECSEFQAWYDDHGFTTRLTYWGVDNGQGNRCIAHAVRLAALHCLD